MALGDQFADRGMPRGIDRGPPLGTFPAPSDRLRPTGSDKADVSTPSDAYLEMLPRWEMIDTVIGGTRTMREAGKAYLPQHMYEGEDAYKERLSRATLKNYTGRTLETLVSKAFRDSPRLNPDVPQQIAALAEDIDLEGNALHVFLRGWFQMAVRRAFAYCLVDFSRTQPAPGQVRTLADDTAEGVRPFWRLVDPADMIYLRMERVGGHTLVAEARMREYEEVPDGWGTRCVQRIRVLTPGRFDLYELARQRRGGRPTWVLTDGGPMGLPYVPMVPFYVAKDGPAEGKPPLEDLAYLNVEHFQSSADQRSILTVARFPILAASGVQTADPNGDPLVIGPKKWLAVADPQGRIYYVEHAGHAISAGRTDLEDLEDQMASYGSEFLRKRPGAPSATGRALDSMEAISPLMAWGLSFKDSIELALKYTADWLKLPGGGTVAYQIKPDVSVGESKELDTLNIARAGRDLSREAYLTELKRRDILAEEFDPEEDLKVLEKEPQVELPSMTATFSANGAGRRGPARQIGEPPVNTNG